MLDVTEPVEIAPAHASAISRAVERLGARIPGCEVVHWYHDEPIWFVKIRQGDVIRRVQIAPFRTKRDNDWIVAIRVIPDIYRLEGEKVLQCVDKSAISSHIRTVPLYDESLRQIPAADVEKNLESEMEKGWKAAQALSIGGEK